MSRVRAAQCTEYGNGDGIAVAEVDVPAPGAGEIAVDVEIAGLAHVDMLVVANKYQVKAPLPFVPGSEFAGVVAEVGEGVTSVRVGDRVVGTMFVGSCAERVVVRADNVRVLGDGVDGATAIAGGVSYATSYHALRSVAAVQPGEVVLVLGASGGVGLAAVEIACALGATVVAAATGAAKLAVTAEAGASITIDYSGDDFRERLKATVPEGIDVVIDPVGGRYAEPALRSLRPGGRFVTVGYASGEIPSIPLNLVLLKGISIRGFEFRSFIKDRPADFARDRDELAALFASGRLRPRIDRSYPLSETPEAFRSIAERRAVGKVLIDVRK